MKIVSSYQMPITPEMLSGETGYRRNVIMGLARRYPSAARISIAKRGARGRVNVAPDEIVYVMATGGKWARSSDTRIGAAVREETANEARILSRAVAERPEE